MAELRTERVNLRVAARDDELFRRAAAARDESLSEFFVASARERAARVLADRTHWMFSKERWTAFSLALDQPANADPALVELFRRPRPE